MPRVVVFALIVTALVCAPCAHPGDQPPDDKVVTVDLGGDVKLKMVRIPAGKFWMGGGSGTAGTKEVEIAEFYLGVYEVTQAQWKSVIATNPSKFKGDDLPVEQVSWNDAQRFVKALNDHAKGKGYVFRLPTEAEWEYACRGAPTTNEECSFNFYFDKATNDLSSDEANFDGDKPAGAAGKGKYLGATAKVGSYKPNKLGLYDMHGNVWEWCEDRYAADGQDRMYRGGSFWSEGRSCAAWSRLIGKPDEKRMWLGLRLAATPK
jgi:formylglycine-generating enzyme required for sulfatase activity